MKKNDVPVLLIGLGGIGSSIVNETYKKLDKEGKIDCLKALVFDTDQNELEKIDAIPNEAKVQTSTDKTVGYVLDRDAKAIGWFPDHPRVRRMSLINGAGQIRAVSRLALRAAMKAGKLNNVSKIKDEIYTLGTNAHEKGVRIMIVSSLMGGTGSGMFLQIPLYLREIFQSKFGADRIEIQGTFLLPDVLKGSIDDKQKMNIYANAYASMKELYNIIMSLAGETGNFELEYRPDQLEKTHDAIVRDWPYDYCFIYDKEDTKGRVLNGVEEYKKMIADNLYSQVYGPISDSLFSYFINTVRESIRKNSRNIFGGVGIGKLVYPYEEISDYITYKSISENLKENLLKIDESFKHKTQEWEKNRLEGIDGGERPNKSEHYMTEFDNLKGSERFFKEVNKQIEEVDEYGEYISDLITEYFDKRESEIESEVDKIIEQSSAKQVKMGELEDLHSGELNGKIDEIEESYVKFRQFINTRVRSSGEAKADSDFQLYDDRKESEFDKALKRNEKYVNPVGIRYILYKMQEEITKMKNEEFNNEEIDKTKKKVENKENEKLKEYKKGINSLHEAINYAISHDNFIGRIFKTMKKFKEAYYDEISDHYKKLKRYCTLVYKAAYWSKTSKMLEALIKEYESMFERLEEQRTGIDEKVEEILKKHNATLGTTNLYVLGGEAYKEEIWNTIPPMLRSNTLSEILPEKLHENLKVNCKMKIKEATTNMVGYDYLFNTLVVDGCKKSIQEEKTINELININIVQALEKEYEYAKKLGIENDSKDKEQYMKDRIASIIDRTEPFAPKSDESTDYYIWGINDNLRLASEGKTTEPRINKIIQNMSEAKVSASKICTDDTYSKNEIVLLHSRYGLLVNDFKKFYAGRKSDDGEIKEEDGEYYTYYQELIKNVSDGSSGVGRNIEVTPHLHKKWHKTLLDLNEEVNKRNKENSVRAYLAGLAMQWIDVKEKPVGDTMKYTFMYDLNDSSRIITGTVGDDAVETKDFLTLYNNIAKNADMVSGILDAIDKHCKDMSDRLDGSDDNSILSDDIIKKLINTKMVFKDVTTILDVIIKLYLLSKNKIKSLDERNTMIKDVLNNLYEFVEDICKVYYSDTDIIKANVKEILTQIRDKSTQAKEIKEESIEYTAIIKQINNKIKEYGVE